MPAALWKRLGIPKSKFRQLLSDMYWNQSMSQAKIAQELQCDITCIENWFRRFDINTRSQMEAIRNLKERTFFVSKDQLSILHGLILSDLHIEEGGFQSRASFGFKHKEFAEAVIRYTDTFQWSPPKYNQKTLGWHSKTKFCTNLQEQRAIWYPNGIKSIPWTLKLNPKVLLWWYLGDGYITKYGAVLCTDSFSKGDNERLSGLLIREGIPSHVTPGNQIRIKGSSGFNKLIDYIGPCPVKCYKYKWGER